MYLNVLALIISVVFAYLSIKYSRKRIIGSALSIFFFSLLLIIAGMLIYEEFKEDLATNDKIILWICTISWIVIGIKNIVYDAFRIIYSLFVFNKLARSSEVAKMFFQKNGEDIHDKFVVPTMSGDDFYWALVQNPNKETANNFLSAIDYKGRKVEISNKKLETSHNEVLLIKNYKFRQTFVLRGEITYLEIL